MPEINSTQQDSTIQDLKAPYSTSEKFCKFHWHKKLSGQNELSGTEYRVLMAFFDHSGSDGTRAFPSLEDVQGEACVSESTAKRAIRTLVDLGWLVLTKRGGKRNGKKFANVYRLGVPATWEPYISAKNRRELEESPENRVTGDPGIENQGHPRSPNRSSTTSDPSRYSGQLRRPTEPDTINDSSSHPPLTQWTVKGRHREEASRLGLDIDGVEHKFRRQLRFENRTCWDSAFWQYLKSTGNDREEVDFPQGTCDFDDHDTVPSLATTASN